VSQAEDQGLKDEIDLREKLSHLSLTMSSMNSNHGSPIYNHRNSGNLDEHLTTFHHESFPRDNQELNLFHKAKASVLSSCRVNPFSDSCERVQGLSIRPKDDDFLDQRIGPAPLPNNARNARPLQGENSHFLFRGGGVGAGRESGREGEVYNSLLPR
jgi:hypothetical protein